MICNVADAMVVIAELEAGLHNEGALNRQHLDTIATLTQERDKWEDIAAERMAKLIIREATLENCTEHLNRWTLASGCNGLRNVDGHLEHILDALDQAEQERDTAQATARVLAEALAGERPINFGEKLGNINGWLVQPLRFIEWAQAKAEAGAPSRSDG